MGHLVVVGGGWAGCAAALAAAKKGLSVTLIERTDRLLASGLVGGIMRNNARYTAAEELIMLGAGELIEITDANARHIEVSFPGHNHATLYDVGRIEAPVQHVLERHGVKFLFQSRVVDTERDGQRIRAVSLFQEDRLVEGDFFIDASGTAGPVGNCSRYGNGCAMCVFRCPTFGPRISIAVKAGVKEIPIYREDGSPGFFSGSCELETSSLDSRLIEEIRRKGVLLYPLPAALSGDNPAHPARLKACRQYSAAAYKDNLVLLDTGVIKMMIPFMPLHLLRCLKGFERAVYRDPLGGSRGNSVRFSGMITRDNCLMVPPLENLLVAGERAGLALGHTEALVTGTLAGFNAWRLNRGLEPLALPRGTVTGELIAYTRLKGRSPEGRQTLYNLSGGSLWEYLCKHELYTVDRALIKKRLDNAGMLNIFA
ncbi:MAG: FAD-dependent oxidoreductase [Bacillota bacterium]